MPNLSTAFKIHNNPAVITCSSVPHPYSYGAIDYENRPLQKCNTIYKKLSMLSNPNSDKAAASVLNQAENEGKRISKWELVRVIKELRKFRRFKLALEVYDWMTNRAERFRVTTSDTAIQLDLIAKVHGVSKAGQYFQKLPDGLKDKRIYGSLLNAYARAKMRENQDSRVEALTSEMKEKGIALDLYTYNIWMQCYGTMGSLDKMEHVFERMKLDTTINPNWSTYSTMPTIYIKSGKIEKAVDCLSRIESRMTGRDRMPFHYLMSSIEGAEEAYDDWLSVRSLHDPRVGNLLLSAYVREGLFQKAETFFDQISKNAASTEGWMYWRPKQTNINAILDFSEQNGDTAMKDAIYEVLPKLGTVQDKDYMSKLPTLIDRTTTDCAPATEETRIFCSSKPTSRYLVESPLHNF
ncbi:hypothetical protein OROHE_023237 [Orobanche hederae]